MSTRFCAAPEDAARTPPSGRLSGRDCVPFAGAPKGGSCSGPTGALHRATRCSHRCVANSARDRSACTTVARRDTRSRDAHASTLPWRPRWPARRRRRRRIVIGFSGGHDSTRPAARGGAHRARSQPSARPARQSRSESERGRVAAPLRNRQRVDRCRVRCAARRRCRRPAPKRRRDARATRRSATSLDVGDVLWLAPPSRRSGRDGVVAAAARRRCGGARRHAGVAPPRTRRPGASVARRTARSDLAVWAAERGIGWIDDDSNADLRVRPQLPSARSAAGAAAPLAGRERTVAARSAALRRRSGGRARRRSIVGSTRRRRGPSRCRWPRSLDPAPQPLLRRWLERAGDRRCARARAEGDRAPGGWRADRLPLCASAPDFTRAPLRRRIAPRGRRRSADFDTRAWTLAEPLLPPVDDSCARARRRRRFARVARRSSKCARGAAANGYARRVVTDRAASSAVARRAAFRRGCATLSVHLRRRSACGGARHRGRRGVRRTRRLTRGT